MSNIYLYTNDVELGTKLTDRLLQLDHSTKFLDSLVALADENSLVVVDLDDSEATPDTIKALKLKYPDLRLIGFMTQIQKQLRDDYRRSGCEMVYLRSALIKNPESILPKTRYNEVLSFIKGGLKDLSISRTTFTCPCASLPAPTPYMM